jgi:hemoglobin-like flavoprotein
MSPDQLAALRAFFAVAEARLPDIVALMYERFFEAMPETAPLFKGDMQEQHRQFTLMLWSIVRLTRSSELWPVNAWTGQAPIPVIEKLGMRHAWAGVQPEHFETMKVVLSRCFREMFPKEFSTPVDKALAFIFDVVSRSTAVSRGNNRRSLMTQKAIASKSYLDRTGLRHGLSENQHELESGPSRHLLKLT